MKNIKQFFISIFYGISKSFKRKPESSMTFWAEREIEIACKNERSRGETDEYDMSDYGVSCYKSALKAYKSLTKDGHSGFSIGITQQILNRLIDGRPLTPIVDTDDVWTDVSLYGGGLQYQCKRMSSLFKNVREDGSYKYMDVNSSYCVDIHSGATYSNGFIRELVDKMFPITLPYMPGKPTAVYCEDILSDPKNGDFDSIGVFYLVKADSEKIELNRFFKEDGNSWAEIDAFEYAERKASSQKLHAL